MARIQDLLPRTRISATIPVAPVTAITPYLPKDAERQLIEHERIYKQPAFVMAFPQSSDCPNCGGIGQVYVRFCSAGPYPNPSSNLHNVSTWYEGSGQFGKGWYTVRETKSWVCPECEKNGRIREGI